MLSDEAKNEVNKIKEMENSVNREILGYRVQFKKFSNNNTFWKICL